jgi:ABC-2 type transport system ATP-binding protein
MCDRVGIIEQGRLLATGTVEEIQRQQSKQSEVRVRVLGGAHGLSQWLEAREDVEKIQLDGEYVRFEHAGVREAEVALLREMVHAGFAILEFGTHQITLEDVFLQVTRGYVQ